MDGTTLPTSEGVSFLNIKHHLLLCYLIDLSYFAMVRSSGENLVNHPVITQLLRLKIYFDKLHPLDNKLKYQIDKLLNMAVTQQAEITYDEKSKLSFKANFNNFIESSEVVEAGEATEGISDKYVPPKRLAVAYNDAIARAEREQERRIEKAQRSQMLEILRQQINTGTPEVYTTTGIEKDKRSDRQEKIITEFEEENMRRISLSSKKEVTKRKRTGYSDINSGVTDLESFSDLAALNFSGGEKNSNSEIENLRKSRRVNSSSKKKNNFKNKKKF